MSCYLCAYQLNFRPERLSSLPPGSPVLARYAFGTCHICSVWACSVHGTRYGQFECAMCTPAAAAQGALSGAAPPTDPEAGATSAAIAHEVGVRASDRVKASVRGAIEDIAVQQREREGSSRDAWSLGTARSSAPHLLLNFAAVIREQSGVEGDFLPAVRRDVGREAFTADAPLAYEEPGEFISIDAIGAAVRAAFAGKVVEMSADTVEIVAGALLLSMAVANQPRSGRHGPQAMDAALSAEVARPWEVTHPVLLDPVMWVIATAYVDHR